MNRLKFVFLTAAVLFAVSAWAAFDFKKLKPSPNKKFTTKQPVASVAIRGLDEPGTEGDMNARDAEAVAWLERQRVAEKDLAKFTQEGGLER